MICTRIVRDFSVSAVVAAALFVLAPHSITAAKSNVNWITDPKSQCSTSNPFQVIGETIRWYGACRDGRLQGKGTLIWYQDQREKERNAGNFRNGEFHGEVITTFPDGQIIVGNYREGVRHGMFTIIRAGGEHFRAVFNRGKGEINRAMTAKEVVDWKMSRLDRVSMSAPSQRPTVAPLMNGNPHRANPAHTQQSSKKRQLNASTQTLANVAKAPSPIVVQSVAMEEEGILDTTLKVINPLNWYDAVVDGFGFGGEPQPAPVEEEGVLDTTLKVINPLNWYDTVADALGFGGDPQPATQVEQEAKQGTRPRRSVAAAPPQRHTPHAAHRTPPNSRTARDQRPSVATPHFVSRRTINKPPGSRSTNLEDHTAGKLYDMSRFLSEPHPFSKTPSGKVWPAARAGFIPVARRVGPSSSRPWSDVRKATAAHLRQDQILEQTSQPAKVNTVSEQMIPLYSNSPLPQIAHSVTPAPVGTPVGSAETLRSNDGRRVVTLNSPLPPGFRHQVDPQRPNYLQIYESDWIGKSVCSRAGLYDENAGWCGLVQRDDGSHLVVTIRNVSMDTFGMIGITRSRCTGGAFLNWFSRGTTVRVPKQCMALQG